ncbi:MAG: hypothetical protein ACPGSD_14160 [Flavobacteriales bacterium]
MKIVNGNKIFSLISVNEHSELDDVVKLELNGNPLVPRNFNDKAYHKYQLVIFGIEDRDHFIDRIKVFTGEYIDIEVTKDGKLDFWSDAYQIGTFIFEKYEEIINPFNQKDWINEYKTLVEYCIKQNDNQVKQSMRWTKFVDKLKFSINKETTNSEKRIGFLKGKTEALEINKKRQAFSKKILKIIDQYENR